MYVQVPQVVMNPVFSYSGRAFAPLVPIWWSINSAGVGREVASEDWVKKVEYLSISSSVDMRLPFLFIRGGTLALTFLFWMTYL